MWGKDTRHLIYNSEKFLTEYPSTEEQNHLICVNTSENYKVRSHVTHPQAFPVKVIKQVREVFVSQEVNLKQ